MKAVGAEMFEQEVDDAAEADRPVLWQMIQWAHALEDGGLARLVSNRGTLRRMLRVNLTDEQVSLVTIYNDFNDGGTYLTPHRSVVNRRAPSSMPRIERIIAPKRIGHGNEIHEINDMLLSALTDAYREATRTSSRQ